ncbi:MAG: protein kinase, partial [Polyangiaceae bacterium]|nr:protein kinase [Polyangiaceae bacterium]
MAPEASSRAAPKLPAALGRYEILSLLGAGGMAQVYLALQRGAFASEKLVVIKQLRPELVSDQVFLTMFMDEARIALQLHHPNVVHTYEVGAEAGDYFLAMEFLEGLTLTQIVRKAGVGGLPLNLHLWILSQVLAGLSYAHELRALDGEPLGIVHRDVSPSNVMITSSGEV